MKTPERQGKRILRGREAGVMGVVWHEQKGRSHVRRTTRGPQGARDNER